jgi:integrase
LDFPAGFPAAAPTAAPAGSADPLADRSAEVEKLIAAARGNRWRQRDATMILIAFRHGLRASELCELQWSDDGDNGEENLIHPGKCPDSFLGSTALQKLKILDRKPRNLRRVIDAGLADLNDFFRDYLCKRVVTVN